MKSQKRKYKKQELICYNGNKRITALPIFELTTPAPTLIYAHGYGYNMEPYPMKLLAEQGIATYSFDFCGGSANSRSEGTPKEMSVMTEITDLNAVIDTIKPQNFVDEKNLFLCGLSQGGFVSTVTAANRCSEIRGLILLCPAYVIQDMFKNRFKQKELILDTFNFSHMTLSRKYVEDIWDNDVYEIMKSYTRDVLIFHGDADNMVPLHYSKRATTTFSSVELVVLPGAGHILTMDDEEKVVRMTLDFIKERLGSF
ncbi:alpha/beta hydrolase [Bacillus sp. SA1-12]|uniref:alpha/beta hydrolase n=1 Tax=Bacillus sp. SA1-12 TaxID=1455638 RepID=UPI0006976FAC|nr:alpha/beta fold hydrolase [Bacillus sp. SA1-12]